MPCPPRQAEQVRDEQGQRLGSELDDLRALRKLAHQGALPGDEDQVDTAHLVDEGARQVQHHPLGATQLQFVHEDGDVRSAAIDVTAVARAAVPGLLPRHVRSDA